MRRRGSFPPVKLKPKNLRTLGLATALLDRLLHHADVISISGKSFRMKDRLKAATNS